jgi:hypothetical protein
MNIMEETKRTLNLRIKGMTMREVKDIIEDKFGALMWHGGGAYPADGIQLQFKQFDGPQSAALSRLQAERDQAQAKCAEYVTALEEAAKNDDAYRAQIARMQAELISKQGAIEMLNRMNDEQHAQIERLQAGGGVVIGYQARRLLGNPSVIDPFWSDWSECSKAQFDQLQTAPVDASGIRHEVRVLYTHPAAPACRSQTAGSDLQGDLTRTDEPQQTAAPAKVLVPLIALQEAHKCGFLRAAKWCERDDLVFDADSLAYVKERDHDIELIATHNGLTLGTDGGEGC